MKDMDNIIKEIALEHGVLLRKEDPAFLFASINEKLLAHYGEQLVISQTDQQKALGIVIERNNELAKQASAQMITKAAHYVHDQIYNACSQLSELIGKDVRAEGLILQRDLEQFRSTLVNQVRTVHWLLFGMTSLTTALLGLWLGLYLAR